jgi:hypothetical protein
MAGNRGGGVSSGKPARRDLMDDLDFVTVETVMPVLQAISGRKRHTDVWPIGASGTSEINLNICRH